NGTILPDCLATADDTILGTTQARCLILKTNIPILTTHPNLERITYDIARAAHALTWAHNNQRLGDA
ncbi:MAG: hypothetical protein LBI33_05620, partial [Propionibacteriaceae bacterium]|nr:hypothetical protein [Propionibacteriaceae bacterium]